MVNAIKKIKHYLAVLLVATIAIAPVMVPTVAYAQAADPGGGGDSPDIENGLCGGAELQFQSQPCQNGQSTTRLNNLIKTIINIISVVVGLVAVIMIVFGGLKYITSGGESSNVSSAKNTILYAIIGLVVVALAQFIVRFVLDKSINSTATP